MPLAAPLVSGDCAPPALEVHDGSLRQHSTHFLARLLFPGGQFPSVREATHRPCPRRRRGARNVIPTPGSPPLHHTQMRDVEVVVGVVARLR
jgi:hypothetical protein